MKIAVLKLHGKTVPFVIERGKTIVTKMTDNENFADPVPGLPVVANAIDLLEGSFQLAIDGGKSKKAMVRINKAFLLSYLYALMGYVQAASGGDEEKILSGGFFVKKTSAPVNLLPPPSNLRCRFGALPGEIKLLWNGVKGHRSYRVEMNTDPNAAANWVTLSNGITGKRQLVVSGLTSGQTYWFRVFTLSTPGYSGPSDVASHMAF